MRPRGPHAGAPRITGVAPWALLAAAWIAGLAYAVALASGAGGPRSAAPLLIASLIAAVAGVGIVARRRRERPWTFLALAIGAYGSGSACYTLVPDAAAAFPSAYDVGLMAAYPLAVVALIGFVRLQVGGLTPTVWLDSCIGALVVASLGATVVFPLLGGADSLLVGGQFAYAVADFGFLGFLLAAYALSGWRDGPTLFVLGIAAAALAAADAVYAVDLAHGATAPSPASSVLWLMAMLVVAVAPYLRRSRVVPATPAWAKTGIPVASAVASLPNAIVAPAATPYHVLTAITLTLVVVRLTMSLHQNARLLAEIHGAATTDRLTGLANRELLFARIGDALAAARAGEGPPLAILFLDLDDFKAINDAHGHGFGDQVLIAVAQRLREAVDGDPAADACDARDFARSDATVARLGGDEFVVLLEGIEDPAGAVSVAEQILDRIRMPLAAGEETLSLDASVGITHTTGDDRRGPADLVRDGDTAMYEAKRAGRHRLELFESEMQRKIVARSEMIRDLRGAIAGRELRVLYQPQVDLATGSMTGVEALVRWEHPKHGLLTPDRFIPLAESSGLIADIDSWVLREAFRQLSAWDDAGLAPLGMAVNVSSRRLVSGDLAAAIAAELGRGRIDPARVEIELTETVAVEQDAVAVDALTRIRAIGVSVAIDDFGVGHSALSRLRTFPVDRLKIDRSFIASLAAGAERGSLVDAMLAMGQSLGLRIVAEGVETEDQAEALRRLGCETAQGYLFGRPVTALEIERLSRMDAALGPVPDAAADEGPGDEQAAAASHERLVRSLLAELQRITGLETTYLTRVDRERAIQSITHARNTGMIDVPEGLVVDWSDTVCRRALEQGVTYTDDVPATFPDSAAARELGLQTYLSVPLLDADGEVEGTLCGASSRRVPLGPAAVTVMERFAEMIAHGVAGRRHEAPAPGSPGGAPPRAAR